MSPFVGYVAGSRLNVVEQIALPPLFRSTLAQLRRQRFSMITQSNGNFRRCDLRPSNVHSSDQIFREKEACGLQLRGVCGCALMRAVPIWGHFNSCNH